MEAAIELPARVRRAGRDPRRAPTLELARTIVRRAERRAVTLAMHDEALAAGRLLPYLNRLADLLWILARVAEQAESRKRDRRPSRERTRAPAPERRHPTGANR